MIRRMDDAEHARLLDELVNRIDVAAERVFDAAERLMDEVHEAEDRADERAGDAVRVDPRTKRRWRRLDQLDAYQDAMTESVVAVGKQAARIRAERPTGAWLRWRQRRRLLWIAKYLERGADRLGRTHP